MTRLMAAVLALMLICSGAAAAELKLLSAGAVEPGLLKAVAQFRQATGHAVMIRLRRCHCATGHAQGASRRRAGRR